MKFSKFFTLSILGAVGSAHDPFQVRQDAAGGDDHEIVVSTIPILQTIVTTYTVVETVPAFDYTIGMNVGGGTSNVNIERPGQVVTIERRATSTLTLNTPTTSIPGAVYSFLTTEFPITFPESTAVVTFSPVETTIVIESSVESVEYKGAVALATVPAVTTYISLSPEVTTIVITDEVPTDYVFSDVGASRVSEPITFMENITLSSTTVPWESAYSMLPEWTHFSIRTRRTVPASIVSITPSPIVVPIRIPSLFVSAPFVSVITTTVTTSSVITISEMPVTYTVSPVHDTYPTDCEVVRGTLTPEEEVQLQVLFSDRAGASAFADYVVSYASRLVAQIADVADIAVGDNKYAFTTAFDTIDIPGVLSLASAAPIYTCFLSSLWAEALSHPQQYAERAVPSQDEKIKLIVLFERRESDGTQFDYAELLVDDTNSLIADVQSVSAAAANGDTNDYASLFANVDVPFFLSIATEAPIYTEGLSDAFSTALESYSQAVNAPTTGVMTTNTYTTVGTIVTNVVSGTLTIPTTYYGTAVRTSVGPVNTERETRTSHTAETRMETPGNDGAVAYYTQTRNGVTYVHSVAIQTVNAAFKKTVALGSGILGAAALLLLG